MYNKCQQCWVSADALLKIFKNDNDYFSRKTLRSSAIREIRKNINRVYNINGDIAYYNSQCTSSASSLIYRAVTRRRMEMKRILFSSRSNLRIKYINVIFTTVFFFFLFFPCKEFYFENIAKTYVFKLKLYVT